VHKLTVQAARGAGNGRHGRDRVMVTIISTVVSNLISSIIIERLINIHAAQKGRVPLRRGLELLPKSSCAMRRSMIRSAGPAASAM
jgi:hypothetical protein